MEDKTKAIFGHLLKPDNETVEREKREHDLTLWSYKLFGRLKAKGWDDKWARKEGDK